MSTSPDVWGIDGDIVCYAVGFAAEGDPLAFALHSTKAMLQDIINDCGSEGIIYLTGSTNYRNEVASEAYPYKGNRSNASKPRHLKDIREYMIDQFDAIVSENEEADDLMGIGAVQQGHGIATIDKDLLGVPGHHWNWKRREYVVTTEEESDRFFYKQLLSGDSTDNIPGLFKMVNRKATKKITTPLDEMTKVDDMYKHVFSVYCDGYESAGMCLDDMEETVTNWLTRIGQCLWIRRAAGEMWVPPNGS